MDNGAPALERGDILVVEGETGLRNRSGFKYPYFLEPTKLRVVGRDDTGIIARSLFSEHPDLPAGEDEFDYWLTPGAQVKSVQKQPRHAVRTFEHPEALVQLMGAEDWPREGVNMNSQATTSSDEQKLYRTYAIDEQFTNLAPPMQLDTNTPAAAVAR